MQKRLPPLDLIRGFEAAARHLSFTRAASELFLTQSAVSRQIQALEEQLGVDLFERRHRALLLTDEGQMLYRAAAGVMRDLQEVMDRIKGPEHPCLVTVTAMLTFSSLWLVPRLASFRKQHPDIDVRIAADNIVVPDLDRARIDLAIRYIPKDRATPDAEQLFAEEVLPMCSPKLLRDKSRPLKKPSDLRFHTLLHDHDPEGRTPYLEWSTWFQSQGMNVQQAGELRFSHYDQMVNAAISGQGVALGRLPLMRQYIRDKQLVAPFEPKLLGTKRPQSSRAFYVVRGARANRPEVDKFVAWLRDEAQCDRD